MLLKVLQARLPVQVEEKVPKPDGSLSVYYSEKFVLSYPRKFPSLNLTRYTVQ